MAKVCVEPRGVPGRLQRPAEMEEEWARLFRRAGLHATVMSPELLVLRGAPELPPLATVAVRSGGPLDQVAFAYDASVDASLGSYQPPFPTLRLRLVYETRKEFDLFAARDVRTAVKKLLEAMRVLV